MSFFPTHNCMIPCRLIKYSIIRAKIEGFIHVSVFLFILIVFENNKKDRPAYANRPVGLEKSEVASDSSNDDHTENTNEIKHIDTVYDRRSDSEIDCCTA